MPHVPPRSTKCIPCGGSGSNSRGNLCWQCRGKGVVKSKVPEGK